MFTKRSSDISLGDKIHEHTQNPSVYQTVVLPKPVWYGHKIERGRTYGKFAGYRKTLYELHEC